MKKSKLLLQIALAAFTGVNSINFSPVFAQQEDNPDVSSNLFLSEKTVYSCQAGTETEIFDITYDNKIEFYSYFYNGTSIKVDNDAELPTEEIAGKIPDLIFTSTDAGLYTAYSASASSRKELYDILKKYDDVISIDETYKKYKNNLWTIKYIAFNDSYNTDFSLRYPELNLRIPSDDSYVKSWGLEGFNVYEFSAPISPKTTDAGICSALKELYSSGSDYQLFYECAVNGKGEPFDFNIYTRTDYLSGDVNSDGIIDMTDLSELSIALVEKNKFTETQHKAADVDSDGAVTLSDLARLCQYVSKKIEAF